MECGGLFSNSSEYAGTGYITRDKQGRMVAAGTNTHKAKDPLQTKCWAMCNSFGERKTERYM